MGNQKFGFDKIVTILAMAFVIGFAIFHSAEVSRQMKEMNNPPITISGEK